MDFDALLQSDFQKFILENLEQEISVLSLKKSTIQLC